MEVGEIDANSNTDSLFALPLVEYTSNSVSVALGGTVVSTRTLRQQVQKDNNHLVVDAMERPKGYKMVLPVNRWKLFGLQWIKLSTEEPPYNAHITHADCIIGAENTTENLPKDQKRPLLFSINIPIRDGTYPWEEIAPKLSEGSSVLRPLAEKLLEMIFPQIRPATEVEWEEIKMADPGYGWQNKIPI